ncbi:MAG: 23S rRNA (guanosine(2251)-2'-O)-methyltransferase RlmB [Firmicutes bacterium]|nr:23S rRNA (guanosine(2251)-2'-O)-methyltransferase RlmB [Bacillota bacterium]
MTDPKQTEKTIIYGRHPVLEALKTGKPIDKLYIKNGIHKDFHDQLRRLASKNNVPIAPADDRALDRLSENGNHQGVLAFLSMREYDSIDDILEIAKQKNEEPFIMVLNEVQDPQNFGSLLRTAEGAGIHGVVIGRRRAAQLSPAVSKASAGADSRMKITKVTNIGNTLDELKNKGFTIIGAEADGEIDYREYDYPTPLVIVMGGEEKGLAQRVREMCDAVLKIPLHGEIASLNVGVAGAIIMFEARRHIK